MEASYFQVNFTERCTGKKKGRFNLALLLCEKLKSIARCLQL